MRYLLASIGLLAGASGCQTFVGIEDAQQHLPRLDGTYVVAIARERPSNPATIDVIRMQGTATLDVDARSLSLSMSILPFGGGTPLSETTLSGIDFPDDSDEVEYEIDIAVPVGALDPNPPPDQDEDARVNVNVRFIAEADYSYCAKPLGPQDMLPSLGSILIDSFAMQPATPDDDCDDELRD